MGKKSNKSKSNQSGTKQVQKVKLRSSLDVFHRLQHDPTLPFNTNDVIIGFSDFDFISTKSFADWRLIENGGDIPMQRIEFFKLKNIVLWDRQSRLDRLFGSGNTTKSQLLSNVLASSKNRNRHKNGKQNQQQNRHQNNDMNSTSNHTPSVNLKNDDTIRVTDKFILFYQGWLSQHFIAPIIINNVLYNCNEQYMMAQKAVLFHDEDIHSQIMKSPDPRKQKKLGRLVDGFRDEIWDLHKEQVIYNANYAKYTQNQHLQQKLLSLTFANRMFVEASRSDRVYGIGLSVQDRKADMRCNWKGQNLLGMVITRVRDELLSNPVLGVSDLNTSNIYEDSEENENDSNYLMIQQTDDMMTQQIEQNMDELLILDHLNVLIEFAESKLSPNKIDTKLCPKKKRKRRLRYLMKNQQDRLWNTFKTKYQYQVPTADILCRTFRTDLNFLNSQSTDYLDGDRITFEDVHFIFDTIFSKRKHDPVHMKRSPSDWNRIFEPYPMEDDGYAVSFEYDDSTRWMPMLERYGFVVLSNVMTHTECDETIRALFEEMNLRNKANLMIKLDDPTTWEKEYWPSSRKFLTHSPAFHPVAFRNRFNPKIVSIFSTIFGTEHLNVSVDNWGLHRPYKTKLDSNGKFVEHPQWQHSLKPHWDYSPWLWVQETERGFHPGYQGIVALNDHNRITGCHRNLPRCTHHLKQWTVEHRYPYSDKSKYSHYGNDNMTYLQKSEKPKENDPICSYMQDVPMRKGDFIVWSWGSLHGNTPNIGTQWRLAQYIRMFPAPDVDPKYTEHDQYAPQRVIGKKRNREILLDGKLYDDEQDFVQKLKLGRREKCLLGMEKY